MSPRILRLEIDGGPASAEQLWYPAVVNYGHYTAMQVRSGRTRGIDLHLSRLDAANRELFGTGLAGERVRQAIRHALGDLADASVRLTVFRPAADAEPSIMVIVRPPVHSPGARAQSLCSVDYQRPVAHVKHVGSFAQIYHGEQAVRNGFDDALLVGPGGVVSETTVGNIGFFDGTAVIWPDAPKLGGTALQLLDAALAEHGVPVEQQTVRVSKVPSFAATFVSNSHGIAPIGRLDTTDLPTDPDLVAMLAAHYESTPWDPI